MKENADKLLEFVVEKAIKSSHLEMPSSDFTNLVMAQVNPKSLTTVYQPLISKMGWIIIMASVIAFVVYLYLISGAEANIWLKSIDFNIVSNNEIIKFLSQLNFTSVTFYAMLACGVMFCAQIPILKYFIDKRQQRFS